MIPLNEATDEQINAAADALEVKPIHPDLQKSIDDLSAAIDRKNALVDELVAALELLLDFVDTAHGGGNYKSYRHEAIAARAAIEHAKRGVAT